MNNKYSKGIIYKITNNLYNETYYGSTIETLNQRMIAHKKNYNLFLKNKPRWCQSFQIIMDDNFKAEKIEDYPCNSLRELQKREDYYIINFDNINHKRAHNTSEEKKAIRAIADQKRHQNNRSEKNEYYKKNLKSNRERGKKIINCPKCNKFIRYYSLSKHRKTKYCLNYIKSSA